ncbi:hypothetical protein Y032_0195g1460 [Ancylostoma ceylanicum]|uniref:Uncharacterized protein n=1 Tax=Ancylostoma ceylanicum TaxID=53326 RepID=A0A016SPM8_9BILA|nr:hypothetical protein Y032_0195g1460 [Ancylostoma ceylanicum]
MSLIQGSCVVVVVVIDALIIWKVFRLRSSVNKSRILSLSGSIPKKSTPTTRKYRIGREVRLALNFLLLSICFLVMTICFNVVGGYGMWQDLAMKLSSNLNLSKWAVYALGNPVIRHRILQLLGIVHVHYVARTSIVTKT